MSEKKVIGKCPVCGNEVAESPKGWFCSSQDCRFGLWKDNAYFKKIGKNLTEKIVTELLSEGHTFLSGCTSQRTWKKYNATLLMTIDEKQRPSFHMEFEKRTT